MMPTRRGFLQASAALAAALLTGRYVADAVPSDGPVERLVGVLGDRAAAAGIGRVRLAEAPEEGDAELIVRLLDVPEDEDPARMLEARRRADFRSGLVVPVDGWILSQTEVHLCILAALA